MANTVDSLRHKGWLNESEPDLRDIQGGFHRFNMVAYCGSPGCVGKHYNSAKGAPKYSVEYPKEQCPDCGFFLRWEEKRSGPKNRAE